MYHTPRCAICRRPILEGKKNDYFAQRERSHDRSRHALPDQHKLGLLLCVECNALTRAPTDEEERGFSLA